MKLMKTMKMCLKCILLFIISCFRESDEKKIEVEDERGIKRRKEESGVFILSQSTKSHVLKAHYMGNSCQTGGLADLQKHKHIKTYKNKEI